MKKLILSAFSLFYILTNAQENNEVTTKYETPKLVYILKGKIGFSQLKLFEYTNIDGNVTQADFLLSSRLSDKFRLEYGVGASEFNGNIISDNQLVSVKNQYIKIPVNLMYTKQFKNFSIIYGLGLYGNYLYKSKIPGYFTGKNVGLNVGGNLQIGINFKLTDELDFRFMFERQSDLTKIEKESFIKQKETNTSLFALNIVYKL